MRATADQELRKGGARYKPSNGRWLYVYPVNMTSPSIITNLEVRASTVKYSTRVLTAKDWLDLPPPP